MSKPVPSSIATPTDATKRVQDSTLSDPFDSPFDDDRDDEWWDDEEYSSKHAPNRTGNSTTSPRQKKWPSASKDEGAVSKSNPKNSNKSVKRYSVHKPTREKSKQRQKKQNAAAGIKVITNFSRHHGPPPVPQQPDIDTEVNSNVPQPIGFVDLAALQALDNQASSSNGGFWKSIKEMMPSKSDIPNQHAIPGVRSSRNTENDIGNNHAQFSNSTIINRKGNRLRPPPLKLESDLSPNDRPIVIGISIPSASIANFVASPRTASSESGTVIQSAGPLSPESRVPEKPAIIVTSKQVPSPWFRSEQENTTSKQRPRATSSVYSRATSHSAKDIAHPEAPPVPQIPPPPAALNKQNRKSRKSVRYSSSTIFSDDGDIASARKSRAISSYTIFEEDESPTLVRKARALSISEGNRVAKHTSTATVTDQRQSKGWWNYLTSPFLTRSNTLASSRSPTQEHPALPSLATAAIKAQAGKYPREWEKSVFSPVTPETSTTISSDTWWDKQNFTAGTTSPDEESGTLPFMLAAGESTAANNGVYVTFPESGPTDDSLKRRPAIRDKFSAQNTPSVAASSTPAETVSRMPALITANPLPQPNNQYLSQPAASSGSVNIINSTQVTASNTRIVPIMREGVQESPQPPPYSPPRVDYPRYRAVLPPSHLNSLPEPPSPGPLSPGLQRAMSSRGAIALADVPLTPAPRRPIYLNSGYPVLPTQQPELFFPPPPGSEKISKKALKVEAKRRRYEKEEAVAHKVGGLWRGRGCVPQRGCYGRNGVEGRKRRRCWFGLIAGILSMIILIVVLSTTLHRSSPTVVEPTQWLNLTGFPPIFTGISTVAAPDNHVANSGCVFPSTVWSCALPKELQQSIAPNEPIQPNFRLQIQWDNSSSANTTFANVTGNPNIITRAVGGNAVSVRHLVRGLMHMARQIATFTPSPVAPSWAEEYFLGNTSDGIVSENKAGEPTPFYVSFLSTTAPVSAKLLKRTNSSNSFPEIVSILNSEFPPDVNPDGTAAPANLVPNLVEQPLRLFDRGLDSEHYGFYNYFNRSIFLKSLVALNESNGGNGEVPDDENGGCTESEASWRCTWSETRFLVQMWTRKENTTSLVNSTSSSAPTSSANFTANDFTRPGSFPYPITITTDRHGGEPLLKKLYCYGIDGREQPIPSSAKLWEEQKDFGGTAINPAPGLFTTSVNSSDASLGGYDGGTGGCSCQWTNWQLNS